MKKILNLCLVTIFTLFLFSCAKEKKEVESSVTTESYTVDGQNSTVQWTAYKTTDKLPVKGTFTEINILNNVRSSEPQCQHQFETRLNDMSRCGSPPSYNRDVFSDFDSNLFPP